ncbi:MAG TPA: hypothetical protein VIF32_00015, partial [Gemmatimonadaceae bacterium]
MRCFARLILCLTGAALVVSAIPNRIGAAADVVQMIEPGGDAAKYWPRWRGPSGQGVVRAGAYRDRWSGREGVT